MKAIARKTRRATGRAFNLIELMLAMAIAGLLLVIASPQLHLLTLGVSLRLAAGEVNSALSAAKIYARRYSANVAVVFDTRGEAPTWTLYRDGNGNGVRRADITRGIDLAVGGPRQLAHFGRRIRFGFPPGEPAEIGNPRQPIQGLDDAIRFNQSDIASFAAGGTATPGTVYLTDGVARLMAVRVTNRSGKIVIWEYLPEDRIWRRIS